MCSLNVISDTITNKMMSVTKTFFPFHFALGFLLILFQAQCQAYTHYKFEVQETSYTRLCSTKNILTVNGQYPGPTIYVRKGETIFVDVYNKGDYNITLHFHGVAQPRNPWSDGPEYITQCPIQPGKKFSQKVIFSEEEGTLWWHAHSDFSRATVHGAIVIYPKKGDKYPFKTPHAEVPVILGEWWKEDIMYEYDLIASGNDPNASDAYTINGQPGDLYNCSSSGTFTYTITQGKTYLLRLINSAMQDMMFFAVAGHNVTVVGSDASYLKPFPTSYVVISPGQTIDVLLVANQTEDHYYMASSVYSGAISTPGTDTTTTTAILKYNGKYNASSSPVMPSLPEANDTSAFLDFAESFRSLASTEHPVDVPTSVTESLEYLFLVNGVGEASVNNLSYVDTSVSILQAYYYGTNGVFGTEFPNSTLSSYTNGTQVKLLDYNSTVEIILMSADPTGSGHPIHLHGYSFYVLGSGSETFNSTTDPSSYNLVDPPFQNTVTVPVAGWVTIRFRATNPGVWFMHCHFDRHAIWGMDTVFIVRNGKASNQKIYAPPSDMPAC